MNKFCQSCGLPMNKDPENGGANADGSINAEYCSYCYKDGEFVGDFKTAKEMQDFCIKKMNEDGMPKFVAWIFTRGIPRLNRWKNI